MYKKANKEAIIQEEFKAYSVVWECEKGHKNFQTIIGKDGTQHDICLKCGEHYEYVVANGDKQSEINCNIPLVMESQFEAYAAFCIECDRQGMKPIKYKDYLEIG